MNTTSTPSPYDDARVRMKYEVPLTWLLGVMAVIVGQAAAVYFAQQRQGELIVILAESNRELAAQVRVLSVLLNNKDIKDVQHDLQLADHDRRLLSIESVMLATRRQSR